MILLITSMIELISQYHKCQSLVTILLHVINERSGLIEQHTKENKRLRKYRTSIALGGVVISC